MEIGQKCVATDRNGSYYREPCEVVGFETSMFGAPLVTVRLANGTETVFYYHELQLEE